MFNTECPEYFAKYKGGTKNLNASLTNGSSGEIVVELEVTRGHVPFGNWKRQNITLQPLGDEVEKYKAAVSDDGKQLSVRINLGQNKINLELPPNTAFISKVSIENEISLCGKYINLKSQIRKLKLKINPFKGYILFIRPKNYYIVSIM